MKIYFPLIVYPIPSEGEKVCDFVLQGFVKEEDAKDLYPDATIVCHEFQDEGLSGN